MTSFPRDLRSCRTVSESRVRARGSLRWPHGAGAIAPAQTAQARTRRREAQQLTFAQQHYLQAQPVHEEASRLRSSSHPATRGQPYAPHAAVSRCRDHTRVPLPRRSPLRRGACAAPHSPSPQVSLRTRAAHHPSLPLEHDTPSITCLLHSIYTFLLWTERCSRREFHRPRQWPQRTTVQRAARCPSPAGRVRVVYSVAPAAWS